MKALQPSSQNRADPPNVYREPPNESSDVEWKSGSSGRGSIPSHPTTSTTTSGGDGDLPSCNDKLECNTNSNGPTIGMKPNKSPRKQIFSPTSSFNFGLQPIILPFHSQLQLFPTQQFHYFSPEGPAVIWHSRTEEGLGKRKKKIEYCCTIPFISLARFSLHLNLI